MFDSVASAHRAASETFALHLQCPTPPELAMAADQETVRWAVSQLGQIPNIRLRNRSSPFVHAQLYHNRGDGAIWSEEALALNCSIPKGEIGMVSPSQNAHLQHLIKSNVENIPLTDMILLIDALAMYLIIYHLDDVPSSYKDEAEQYLDLLIVWPRRLRSAIPSQLSDKLSPWQAWFKAESARRTMIASYLIRGTFYALKRGYCDYQFFIESLPFDSRTGLWTAMSEEEWQSALVRRHGGVPTVLTSFREFIESSGPTPRLQGQEMFQKMLLVVYHGSKALDKLE